MKVISTFLTSLFLLLLWDPALGQSKFLPSAVRLGTDLTNLGATLLVEGETKYEFHGDIDFHKYFFVVDFGNSETTRQEDFEYFNEGTYARVGLDANFLHHKEGFNVLFFGLRYAASTFNDRLTYTLEDEIWGDQTQTSTHDALTSRWYEITAGMKVRIWNQFYLGYTVRFKLGLKIKGRDKDSFNVFSNPGFGRTDNNSNVGFNYHVFYRLPFRKKIIEEKANEKRLQNR